MPRKLVLAPEAEDDVSEAFGWYEHQRSGLGEEFLRCVEACILSIQRSPTMYPSVQGSYRRAIVRRFPYAIFYAHDDDTVFVYCVFH